MVLTITLAGLYGMGWLWVRSLAPAIQLARGRVGTILVAGDVLEEEFEVRNSSRLPLLWAEFVDQSTVPNYVVGRVVACGAESFYRWHSAVVCPQRGVFRLGPHAVLLQDPLGLFSVEIVDDTYDLVLIYPRVVQLPAPARPKGQTQGSDRQRRPLFGPLPAATVSDYRPGDSLRHVHWLSTASRGRLMVKEMEIEPSGNLWIVIDLDTQMHRGVGADGTLEHSIVVAASLAAQLLTGNEQRAVGLLAYGRLDEHNLDKQDVARENDRVVDHTADSLIEVSPVAGSAQVWSILAALAPVQMGKLPLHDLLTSHRPRLGRRGSVMVIAPVLGPAIAGDKATPDAYSWLAELLHFAAGGVTSSVVLVAAAGDSQGLIDVAQEPFIRTDIPVTISQAGTMLPPLLTFRRRRRVIRSTPTGGVVSYDVDEEVG